MKNFDWSESTISKSGNIHEVLHSKKKNNPGLRRDGIVRRVWSIGFFLYSLAMWYIQVRERNPPILEKIKTVFFHFYFIPFFFLIDAKAFPCLWEKGIWQVDG